MSRWPCWRGHILLVSDLGLLPLVTADKWALVMVTLVWPCGRRGQWVHKEWWRQGWHPGGGKHRVASVQPSVTLVKNAPEDGLPSCMNHTWELSMSACEKWTGICGWCAIAKKPLLGSRMITYLISSGGLSRSIFPFAFSGPKPTYCPAELAVEALCL